MSAGLVELQLREDQVAELLGHAVGDDEGLDQATRLRCGVGLPELDDRLDRLELNEVCVSHGFLVSPRRAARILGSGVAGSESQSVSSSG